MGSLEPKKLALLRILQILQKHSDHSHPLTQSAIAQLLEQEYGIVLERKAISRNLSLLKEAGFEITSEGEGSYLAERDFLDSELHLLIDAVLCSRHISANFAKDLIQRISALSNRYFQTGIQYIHSISERGHTDNQQLFWNISVIDRAIQNGKQIHYDYNKYGVDKKLHRSSEQYVSPYQMILHNQRYYLMAYSEYWGNMVFHRLDHITNMTQTDRPAIPLKSISGYEQGINYKNLTYAMPYMYSDKPERIEFTADLSIVDQVVDWFGDIARITKNRDGNTVTVVLRASPNAMEHWAMQYMDYVEIKAPESLRRRIRESLESGLKKYV